MALPVDALSPAESEEPKIYCVAVLTPAGTDGAEDSRVCVIAYEWGNVWMRSMFTDRIGEAFRFLTVSVATRTPAGIRREITDPKWKGYVCRSFHSVSGEFPLVGVVITNESYQRRVAFQCCGTFIDEFRQFLRSSGKPLKPNMEWSGAAKFLQAWKTPENCDKILRIQKEVEATKLEMMNAISMVLARGEKLDDLLDRSAELSTASRQFYKGGKKLNSRCPCLIM